jgi:hypothetical protein
MSSFYQMETHLTTNANPISPMHPANKRYVDGKVTNVDGARFVSGTIDVDKLPGMVGDVTSAVGSNVLTLNNSGVVPGVFNSVTVDGKGRVTNGTFTPPNTSDLSWTIVQNKPTTLGGYGISDVVSLSAGDTVASMAMSATQSEDLKAAVTKGSIDALMSELDLSAVKTGEVVRYPTTLTPGGFLRANGGILDKTAYSVLYAIIGDAFFKGTLGFAGKPWSQQSFFNTGTNTTTLNWTTGPTYPIAIAHTPVVALKNRVYAIGGYINESTFSSSIYTAAINPDGTLSSWVAAGNFPIPISSQIFFITKNRFFVVCGATTGGVGLKTTYSAVVNADGTLGAWENTGNNLPTSFVGDQCLVTHSRVYVFGGTDGTMTQSPTFYAPINMDGTLGAWVVDKSLPRVAVGSQVVNILNRVYLISGKNNSSPTNLIHWAPIHSDGTIGEWSSAGAIPAPLYASTAAVTRNRIYMFGGITAGPAVSSAVYTAPINADGTLGTWSAATSLPAVVHGAATVITSSRLYLIGSAVSGYISTTIYTAAFNGGSNDYMALIDLNTVNTSTQFRLPDYSEKESDGLYHYIKY